MALLRRICGEFGLDHTAKFGERELALVVLEAAQDRSGGRVDQEDRQQRQGGADEDPRQDPVAPLRLEQADQPAHAEEQQPDAADAHDQGDHRQQELGDHLIALAVAQVGRAGRVADRVVDRGQEVRPALRVVQDEDAADAQAEADQPRIGRTKRDSPGLSARA